jgi:hypothetical protein
VELELTVPVTLQTHQLSIFDVIGGIIDVAVV